MIEIHQSTYNPDELAWEVIVAITDLLKGGAAKWGDEYEQFLENDRALFEKVASGDDSNATLDEWRSAEEGWRDLGSSFGIAVYDDGYAGWTYVGTELEIEEFQNKQEEEV